MVGVAKEENGEEVSRSMDCGGELILHSYR
jgi:hypothetical protein